ncbi:MAG: glycosyltransferase [Candidatus Magasanikbacteria bacterium]|nr:glycosyltransferase [Candidatus Magasanikbacteria bacterium]
MDLSIITVTWNSADKIAEQISSVVLGAAGLNYEQIIVDNGSTDNTTQIIEDKFKNVKLIKNKGNKGFSAANNQGVKTSSGKFILFLNPDMRLKEDSLKKIVDWMEEKNDVGIAGCKLIDKNGEFDFDAGPRRFPKTREMLAMIFKIHHIFPNILDNYLMKNFDPELEQEVDSLRGSFMLVRRELIEELGWGFDPRYFIWFEDVDLCREAKKHGYKVVYTPIITCVDYVGSSFKKRESLWKQKQFTKSMFKYFKKWKPWYSWVWIAMFRPVGLLLAWFNKSL